MEPTERQKEIIRAAFTLIADKGIQDLTIKNLGKAIGVSEPAIYRHFASKSEILSGIVDEIYAIKKRTTAHSFESGADSPTRLRRFFLHQAAEFEAFPPLSIVLTPEDLFRSDRELLARVRALMAETRAAVTALLAETGSGRASSASIDPETGSLMMLGGFRMLVSTWRMERELGHDVRLTDLAESFIGQALKLME
ncbi:MAG TPA: TetR/AcrR family transcriptional regulator [Treponemataceae bacterium]|nr:TetR/AcrR family transcriptional regulator [Treponemataceae bacterium]